MGATLPGYRTSTSWFHNGTDATVSMTGAEPKLNSAYSYDTTLLTDIVNTKQDIPVKATISIGDTNITADIAFLHTSAPERPGATPAATPPSCSTSGPAP